MKTITFVRHAQSVSNAGGITEAPATIPLTEKGWEQARRLIDVLEKPEVIITSPYLRTKQTASFIEKLWPDTPSIEWPIQEFTYLSLDKYRNTSFLDRLPAREDYWKRADPYYHDGPDVESFIEFNNRVKRTVRALSIIKEESILLFCHGQFMKSLWWEAAHRDVTLSDKDRMLKTKYAIDAIALPNTAILKLTLPNTTQFKTNHIEDLTF